MASIQEKTLRRVSDFAKQREETYRYWQSRTVAERLEAIDEIIRSAYLSKGIDIDRLPKVKTLVKVERPGWKVF